MATVKQVALLKEAPKVDILLIDAATTAIPGQQYRATDTDEIAYGKEDGSLRWLGTQDSETGFAVTDGTTSVNIGNDEIIEYTYGSLVKGILTETPEGGAAFAVGLDTDGATSGQVIKMVNIGTAEAPELVPQWAVDSASGFTQHSVPFALEDGTLGEDNDNFRYLNDSNNFLINLPESTKVDAGDVRFGSNFGIRYNPAGSFEDTYMSFRASVLEIGTQDVNFANPSMNFRPGVVDAQGERTEFQVGQNLGSVSITAEVGAGKMTNLNKQDNESRQKLVYSKITGVQGTIAGNDHKVESATTFQVKGFNDPWNAGHDVMTLSADSTVTLHGYTNENANYLYTDANGVIQMGEQIIPNAIGTENQILQVINTGTVEAPVLSLEWVDAGSGFVADANNGLTVTDGIVQLGGALTQSTTVTTVGQSLSFENNDLAFTVADGVMQFRGAPGEFKMTDASLTFQDDRTDAAQVGIEYAADYSATFVDNSLVTKKFVTNLFDAVVYQNGITQADTGEVELGGALTKSTTIGLGTHGLNFTTAGGSIGSTADINISDTTKGLVLTAASGFQYRVGVAEDSDGNGFLTVSATGNSVQ